VRDRLGPGLLALAACTALAALSLLLPSIPSYDPFSWIVWGREIVDPHLSLSTSGGPSWKPLPVVFTTVFALLGGAAPYLWLVVARTGGLLALAGAYRLGTRLAGRTAGVIAAAGVLLTSGFVQYIWRGASEPLLIAFVLWAILAHLDGHRRTAFALGIGASLIRPEAWPFVGLYALWLARGESWRTRALLLSGLALIPVLWFGPTWIAQGSPFAASEHAASYNGHTGSNPGWTALKRGIDLAVAPVWALALAAIAFAARADRRDRLTLALALGALAWLLLVVVMTIGGYPGLARFMLPSAALACVLAGVGVARLAGLAGGGARSAVVALALAIVAVALSWSSVQGLRAQERDAVRAAHVQAQLSRAIAAAGGRKAVLSCGNGTVATNHTAQSALAWKLHVPLATVLGSRIAQPGILFLGPHIAALGGQPQLALRRRQLYPLVRSGVWNVVVMVHPGVLLPAACRKLLVS
jgi:hypothetical protein